MIRHPLLMAVLMGDLISLLLLLSAAKTALKTVTEWAPQSASGQQIRLERSVEAGELTAKFALAAFLASTLLLFAGITNVLPAVIPGAMCGTGVLQATQGLMGSALFCRFLTLGILYLWLVLEKLNSLQPDRPLVVGSSRILLLAVPFHVLAVATTLQAVWQMDAHQPVDCCAVVYDQFQSLAMARQTAGIPNSLWLLAFWTLSILLLLSGLFALRAGVSGRVKISGWTALLALLWVPSGSLPPLPLVPVFVRSQICRNSAIFQPGRCRPGRTGCLCQCKDCRKIYAIRPYGRPALQNCRIESRAGCRRIYRHGGPAGCLLADSVWSLDSLIGRSEKSIHLTERGRYD